MAHIGLYPIIIGIMEKKWKLRSRLLPRGKLQPWEKVSVE